MQAVLRRVFSGLLCCVVFESAFAAPEPEVKARLDSPLIQRTLAMPIAEDNVFFIDDTLRYFGFYAESDLFQRHMKRLVLMQKLHGTEINRAITAKEAIARERDASLDTLLRLREEQMAKALIVTPIPQGERPWRAASPDSSYKQVAPSLWTSKEWGTPGLLTAFYFGIKMTARQPLGAEDGVASPQVKIVTADGRQLELECNFDLQDLFYGKPVLDWCGNKPGNWSDEELISIAGDLADGKRRLHVSFTQSVKDENNLWLKTRRHAEMDFRAMEVIKNSSCSDRGECGTHFIRVIAESKSFWLAAAGFVIGTILATALRSSAARSTSKVLGILGGIIFAGTVVAGGLALVANSLLVFLVPPFAAIFGGGMLAGGLVVCFFTRRPHALDSE